MKPRYAIKSLNKFLFITGVLLNLSIAHAEYTFSSLGALGAGSNSYATSINNLGEIVGYNLVKVPGWRDQTVGFSWSDKDGMIDLNSKYSVGYMTPLTINDSGTIGANYISPTTGYVTGVILPKNGTSHELGSFSSSPAYSEVISINNNGVAAGYALTDASKLNAITWNSTTGLNRVDSVIGDENYTSTAGSINDKNQIVGSSSTSHNQIPSHATLWENGVSKDLGTLGGNNSYAKSINNYGQIVGYSDTTNYVEHAVLWDGDSIIDLGSFYANLTSRALSINNSGDIVGWSYLPNQASRAALWKDGQIIDLNSFLDVQTRNAGWVLTQAIDINDNGSIVGNAYNTQTRLTQAFLLAAPAAAVPEPESYSMLLAGLGILILVSRRKLA